MCFHFVTCCSWSWFFIVLSRLHIPVIMHNFVMLFSDPGFFSIHYIGQWQCPPYIMSSIHALRQALMRSTVAQDYMYLRVHWEVNEWSDRLIDLRCVNGSSPGEKVSYALSFTTPGFFLHLYICVFCETVLCPVLITPLSHTDSLKWLIGCLGLFAFSTTLFTCFEACSSVHQRMVTRALFFPLRNLYDICHRVLQSEVNVPTGPPALFFCSGPVWETAL